MDTQDPNLTNTPISTPTDIPVDQTPSQPAGDLPTTEVELPKLEPESPVLPESTVPEMPVSTPLEPVVSEESPVVLPTEPVMPEEPAPQTPPMPEPETSNPPAPFPPAE